MFLNRVKACLKLGLPAFGLALLAVVSCAGNDAAPAAAGNGGEPGTGGQADSGGAASENPIPCSCASEGAAGAGLSFCEVGMATLRDVCGRVIAVNDYLQLTLGACEPDTRLHHNIVYPGAGPIPETEAPRNTDPQRIAECIDLFLNDPTSYPWEGSLNNLLCFTEAVWDCNGTWYSDNCGGVPLQTSCSE